MRSLSFTLFLALRFSSRCVHGATRNYLRRSSWTNCAPGTFGHCQYPDGKCVQLNSNGRCPPNTLRCDDVLITPLKNSTPKMTQRDSTRTNSSELGEEQSLYDEVTKLANRSTLVTSTNANRTINNLQPPKTRKGSNNGVLISTVVTSTNATVNGTRTNQVVESRKGPNDGVTKNSTQNAGTRTNLRIVAKEQRLMRVRKNPEVVDWEAMFGSMLRAMGARNYLFVSSTPVIPGKLGGIVGADVHCQVIAESAGLEGTFLAWLSVNSTTEPAARFSKSLIPYYTPNDEFVANDFHDLVDGNDLRSTIAIDETGEAMKDLDERMLVSATSAFGRFSVEGTCNGFTNTSGTVWGSHVGSPSLWPSTVVGCNQTSFLLCVQQ